jgi:hypothetical protein
MIFSFAEWIEQLPPQTDVNCYFVQEDSQWRILFAADCEGARYSQIISGERFADMVTAAKYLAELFDACWPSGATLH